MRPNVVVQLNKTAISKIRRKREEKSQSPNMRIDQDLDFTMMSDYAIFRVNN